MPNTSDKTETWSQTALASLQLHPSWPLKSWNSFNCGATIRKVVADLGVEAEWTMEAAAEDYRNTIALEEKMASDPAERERWIQEQLGIEFEEAVTGDTLSDVEEPSPV